MSKRARYDGPYQEVAVFDPEADVYAPPVDKVKQGGLLSKEVSAKVRDSLLEGAEWTEVEDPGPSKQKDKE